MTAVSRRLQAEKDVEEAERLARSAADRLDRAVKRLDALDTEPEEPRRNAIIKFQVQYKSGETVYSYVANRAPTGDWYVTNRAGAMSWTEMVELMYRDVTAKRLGIGFLLFTKKGARWVGRENS